MKATDRITFEKSPEPAHLPEWPVEPEGYQRLYSFNHGVDDYMEEMADWQVLRIPLGLPEVEVYRRLPSAPDFEYGGYLTKTRIRFLRCGPDRANTRMSKRCTFHSHPTDSPHADLPSVTDVYSFLAFRHVRAVTVGATQLWVWDKTKTTMATVRKLATWTEANQLREIRRLEAFRDLGHCRRSEIVLDGGNVVGCRGKAILTDKMYKENPGWDRPQLRRQLRELLQVDQLIIIPKPSCPPQAPGRLEGREGYSGGAGSV